MQMYVDEDRLVEIGNVILSLSKEFEECIKRLMATTETINNIWTGSDAEVFLDMINSRYVLALTEIQKMMEDYGNRLESIPSAYGIIDDDCTSKNSKGDNQ